MRTYDEVVKDLDSNIPRDVIESRDGGGGRQLSYLPGHYVIDRLNKVLGQTNWAYSSEVTPVHSGKIQDRFGKDVFTQHYIAKVRLVVTVGDKPTEFIDYGYGDGTDKTNPGKAHELAVKESITDGLKRCAKNLGMSMGLALYNKTQENVDENEPISVRPGPNTPTASVGPVRSQPTPTVSATPATSGGREQVNKLIRATSSAIIAKKAATQDQLVALVKHYGVDTKEQLTDGQAASLLSTLEGMLK